MDGVNGGDVTPWWPITFPAALVVVLVAAMIAYRRKIIRKCTSLREAWRERREKRRLREEERERERIARLMGGGRFAGGSGGRAEEGATAHTMEMTTATPLISIPVDLQLKASLLTVGSEIGSGAFSQVLIY